jgi:hypothetical protein
VILLPAVLQSFLTHLQNMFGADIPHHPTCN